MRCRPWVGSFPDASHELLVPPPTSADRHEKSSDRGIETSRKGSVSIPNRYASLPPAKTELLRESDSEPLREFVGSRGANIRQRQAECCLFACSVSNQSDLKLFFPTGGGGRRERFTFDFFRQTRVTTTAASLGKTEAPRWGKDHFALADWRISLATYQQRKRADGTNVDYAESVIERADGTCQKVTIESPSTVGLPTAGDEDVVIALLALAKAQGFASDMVRFVPSQILRIMGIADTQKNYERLKRSLKRLRAVTVTYEQTWYSRETNAVEPVLMTGILAEAKIVLRKGRRGANVPADSYVQWTRNFHQSLQAGNLTDLDLDLYFQWARPGAKHLHRHLNKVWHAGKKSRLYERDLKELACGHLGMTDSKDLKRNFQAIIEELERREYLQPVEESVRYHKVRPGVWRVRLELHPTQTRTPTSGRRETATKQVALAVTDAERLVALYHAERFGRAEYHPKRQERNQAEVLLERHDFRSLEQLVPAVAARVRESFRGKDCHFGAAVAHFELACDELADLERLQSRRDQEADRQSEQRASSEAERVAQQERKNDRLDRWQQLSPQDRSALFERAIELATSEFTRSRLRRLRGLANPPTEVLALLDDGRGVIPPISSAAA